MSRSFVTKPTRTDVRVVGQCLVCGAEFLQPLTGRKRVCCDDDNHRQILSRIRRTQSDEKFHPKYGTGHLLLVGNSFQFESVGRRKTFLITREEARAVYGTKQSQERPNRRLSQHHAFGADRRGGHDPSWPAPMGAKGVALDKQDTFGYMASPFEARVRRYGKRTRGGRHRKNRDWSEVINAELASYFFKK